MDITVIAYPEFPLGVISSIFITVSSTCLFETASEFEIKISENASNYHS